MKRAAVGMLAGSLVLGGRAYADEEEPAEIGRTLAQVGLGATVATAGLFLIGATLDAGVAPLMFMLATPAAVGWTVCAMGERGAYHGSCPVAVASAYLGAASIFPLIYFSALTFRDEFAGEAFIIPTEVAFAFLAGWVIVQPVVSTFGWRMFATPRPPSPSFTTAPRRPNLGPRKVMVPVLSVAF